MIEFQQKEEKKNINKKRNDCDVTHTGRVVSAERRTGFRSTSRFLSTHQIRFAEEGHGRSRGSRSSVNRMSGFAQPTSAEVWKCRLNTLLVSRPATHHVARLDDHFFTIIILVPSVLVCDVYFFCLILACCIRLKVSTSVVLVFSMSFLPFLSRFHDKTSLFS